MNHYPKRMLTPLNLNRVLFIVILFIGPSLDIMAQKNDVKSMLESFVESYRSDPMAHSVEFGIKVGDQWWVVQSKRSQESYLVGKKKQYTFHNFGPHEVTLGKGMPSVPTWYFDIADEETLKNLYSKKWTASTASAKSRGSDKVALEIRDMEGFSSGIMEDALVYEVMEHFWKKDRVEIVRFTRDGSLPTHGVDHVGLYTMKDKRIGWFSIGPEQAANAERGMDKGQVPNLFIITKGKGKADFGEGEVALEPGMSVFIPAYMKHVIYNPYDEPMEGIVVLFGDNIDYARGQSYMDFLELQHEFYESYDDKIKASTNKEN